MLMELIKQKEMYEDAESDLNTSHPATVKSQSALQKSVNSSTMNISCRQHKSTVDLIQAIYR